MKKYLVIALFLAAILIPGAALAESESPKNTDDVIAALQKQIAELMAKIERLKAEKAKPSFCYAFGTNLGIGMTGPDVTALRTALRAAGIDTAVEGEFDEELAGRVVKFQGKYGILQTGYIGPLTRAKLNRLYNCDPAVREAATKEAKHSKEVKKKEEVKKETKKAE